MDPSLKNKTLGVHQQLPLPAADLLTTIVSSRFSAHSARLCRLRVHYPGTGLGISSEPTSLAGSRNIGLKILPFSVGEIGGVAPFHAQERTSSTCPTRFFKQSLEEFFSETQGY